MNNKLQEEIQGLTALECLSQIIESNQIPDSDEFLQKLQNDEGKFVVPESIFHDYKDEFPFSNSNEHFGGILRIICAFHNSYGGLLLFGIHDTTRMAGKNKVVIDIEKINRKLRESLTSHVEISHKKFSTFVGAVDVILIPKRKPGIPPIRFSNSIAKYSGKKIFLRRGAEVLDATGSDLEFLYGRRVSHVAESIEYDTSTESALPSSPATLSEFVGRFGVIEETMKWFTSSRDPRFFLWGAGGSGKSTIAYEFAKIVSSIGKIMSTFNGNSVDRVIYLTAKQKFLNPYNAKIEDFSGTDFENARELFLAILTLSKWTESDIANCSDEELISHLENLFDIETQLIVIDDIDTLLTANQDLGMEDLFGIVARCSSGTKILYTQRNQPTYAKRAAIEVPGLDKEFEFSDFCISCSSQFNVPAPNNDELQKIYLLSEGRPLAIETIIGLRRIAATYNAAMDRWNSNNSQAREYLFQREYERLDSQQRGKHLLAALAVFAAPQNLATLQQILAFSDEQMQDAIAETRDIFLKVIHKNDTTGDLYFLGGATQSFVLKVSEKLDLFQKIRARVEQFSRDAQIIPAPTLVIVRRAEYNIDRGDFFTAINLLTNPSLPPAVTEHPQFKATLGIAYSKIPVPRNVDSRILFEEASRLGCIDYKMYICWVEMEINAGTGSTLGIDVCKKVLGNTKFNHKTRATFYKRLAFLQIRRAGEIQASSPEEFSKLRKEAMINSAFAFFVSQKLNINDEEGYFEKFRITFFSYVNCVIRDGSIEKFFDFIDEIFESREDVTRCLDVLLEGLIDLQGRIVISQLGRFRARLSKIISKCTAKNVALNDYCKSRTAAREKFISTLKDLNIRDRG